MSQNVTRNTYLRSLRFSVINKIAQMLDGDESWRDFVCNIPKRKSTEPKFTNTDINLFANEYKRQNGSPTHRIIEAWGIDNSTVGQLIDVLVTSRLYFVADYLTIDVMKGDRAPRLPEDDENLVKEPQEGSCTEADIDKIVPPDSDSKKGTLQENYLTFKVEPDHLCKDEPIKVATENIDTAGEKDTSKTHLSGEPIESKSSQILTEERPDIESQYCQATTVEIRQGESTEVYARTQMASDLKTVGIQQFLYEDLRKCSKDFNQDPVEEKGSLLGHGGFGTVFLGKIEPDDTLVAIKRLNLSDQSISKQFLTEIELLIRLKHVNLLPLVGYSFDGPQFCIVYPYMCNGSLEDRLLCKGGTPRLEVKQRVNITKETARGIVYLNNNGIVHRDIKSANILLDENFVAKVGDFGFARAGPQGKDTAAQMTATVIGTSAYMAPEAIQRDISAKLDSYSYGVVILELLTSLPSYDADREERDLGSFIMESCDEIMEVVDISAGDWTESAVKELYRIAEICLTNSKRRRPTLAEVLPDLERL